MAKCEMMVGELPDRTVAGRLTRMLSNMRHQPLSLLRLIPILIVAVAIPFLLAPLVRGPPQVPEPRCVG